MKYEESYNVELKEEFIDRIQNVIVGFLNSNGGKIYVGVSNDGCVVGIDENKKIKLILN